MLHANDKRTCDAVNGNDKLCNRTAIVESIRTVHPASTYSIDYCDQHEDRASVVAPYILVKQNIRHDARK